MATPKTFSQLPILEETMGSSDILAMQDVSEGSTHKITLAELAAALLPLLVPSVPDAPTIGTATATGPTGATVSFSAPGNGGSPITSYTATSSPGDITGTLSQSGSGTINITGLTPDTEYTFTVTATNGAGESAPSEPSNSITTDANATVPGAPTIGVATTTGSTTATVAFTAPGSDGGAAITSYTATSSPGGITGVLNQAGSGTINVSGLTPETEYTFTVIATNSVGDSGPSEPSNNITTDEALTAYYGKSVLLGADMDTEAEIVAELPDSAVVTTNDRTIVYPSSVPTPNYLYYAFPESLGVLTSALIDALESIGDFEAPETVDFSGTDYLVYRSTNALQSAITVQFS